ncbi:DUF6325 family protein [Rhodococcus artemisiae]|uniref:DUF6325 family protein n=1 Tax=Rhodococcus artemisiae TaxID=714159 RepID=A0ABU7L5Z3_9NOCA|nr:DUF6325 family protein [Rhodococcus artemisiae]MEE2056767.1 DUF6325 family protein [Rhodococcus artemisiae]
MTQPAAIGPVEMVVLSFPGTRIDPAVTAAFGEVVDRGYATVLDLIYLAKDADGSVTQIEIDEPLSETGLDGLTVDPLGLVSDDDLEVVRSSMEPGTSAVVIVYEETWARQLAGEVRAAGGEVELHVQVPRDAVEAALSAT